MRHFVKQQDDFSFSVDLNDKLASYLIMVRYLFPFVDLKQQSINSSIVTIIITRALLKKSMPTCSGKPGIGVWCRIAVKVTAACDFQTSGLFIERTPITFGF